MDWIKVKLKELAPQGLMLIAISFIATLTSIPREEVFLPLYLTVPLLLFILLSGLSPLAVCKKALVVLPFAALLSLALPFMPYPDSKVILSFHNISFALSRTGFITWLFLIYKAFLAVSILITINALSPFCQLLSSLTRLGVPRDLVFILLFTYRYLFIIREEALSLRRAALSTNFRPRNIAQAAVTGGIITSLLLRSLERAERTYQAMQSRGYRGSLMLEVKALRPMDYLVITGWLLTLLILRWGGL